MIKFTDAAYNHIQALIKKRTETAFFRLSVKQTGCSGYMYQPEIIEAPKEDDILVKTAGELMVLVDPKCLHMIKGTTVDYIKKSLGQYQLHFDNPNAIGACGCGESFHLKEGDDE